MGSPVLTLQHIVFPKFHSDGGVFVYFTFPLYVAVGKPYAKFCHVFFNVQGLFCIIIESNKPMKTSNYVETRALGEKS